MSTPSERAMRIELKNGARFFVPFCLAYFVCMTSSVLNYRFNIGEAEWLKDLTIHFVAVRNQTIYQNIIENTNSTEVVRQLEEPDDHPHPLHIHNGTFV